MIVNFESDGNVIISLVSRYFANSGFIRLVKPRKHVLKKFRL